MVSWKTIAPIIPEWQPDFALEAPVEFEANVTLGLCPDWCKSDSMLSYLSLVVRDQIRDDVTFALVSSYEGGEAIGEPHPMSVGQRSRSRQSVAREALSRACASMWIVLPTGFSYRAVIDASRRDDEWRARAVATYNPFLPLQLDLLHTHTRDEVDSAVTVYRAIKSLERSGAIWTALRTLWSALTEPEYEVRYLLTWVALEALFGPRGGGELGFRITQRLSLFLSTDRSGARDRFDDLKRAYTLRCKLVHGGRPSKLSGVEAMDLLRLSEESLRESLQRVLSSDEMTKAFRNEIARDTFLDSLVFTE